MTYGGRSANITTHPNGTQEYRIADHLGSNRVTLENTGSVVTTTDYEPFGKAIAGVPPRKGFIDKEKDQESGLGDFGVRKYDDEIGRFTSPDPLWEEYRAWSPYQYSLPTFKSEVQQVEELYHNILPKVSSTPDISSGDCLTGTRPFRSPHRSLC